MLAYKNKEGLSHRNDMYYIVAISLLGVAILVGCSMPERREGNVINCLRNSIAKVCVDTNRRQVDTKECLVGVDSVIIFDYQATPETVHDHTGLWLDDVSEFGAPVVVYHSNGQVAVEYKHVGVSGIADDELLFIDATTQDSENSSRPTTLRKNSIVHGALHKENGVEYYRIYVR